MTTGPTQPLSLDQQIRALIEVIGAVAGTVSRLSSRVDALVNDSQATSNDGDPAPWALADCPEASDDPQAAIGNFVEFYNATYVGIEGTKAKPIPPCWRDHPGLAVEIATLAFAWRAANVGPTANIRDAQQWHHQWRPGFVHRMLGEWAHVDCFDGVHR